MSVLNKFSLRSFKVDDQEKAYLVNGEPVTALNDNPVSRTVTGQPLGIPQNSRTFRSENPLRTSWKFVLKSLLISL